MREVTFWSVNLIVFLLLHYETALVDDWDVIGLAGLGEVRVAWVAGEFAAAVILVEELGVLALVGWLKNPFLIIIKSYLRRFFSDIVFTDRFSLPKLNPPL